MARIQLKFAELHSPLFLFGDKGGKNMGVKLDPTKVKGLTLEYDRTEKELHVEWEGMKGFVPSTNVASMVEGKPTARPQVVQDTTQRAPVNAQVETPYGHVFEGPGKGKTK